jgi:hypothetical protein
VPRRRGFAYKYRRLGLQMIGIPLFYVLSVGPAGWLCEKVDPNANSIPERIFLAAYSPLGFVAERTDSQELLLRYCSLFVELKGL